MYIVLNNCETITLIRSCSTYLQHKQAVTVNQVNTKNGQFGGLQRENWEKMMHNHTGAWEFPWYTVYELSVSNTQREEN